MPMPKSAFRVTDGTLLVRYKGVFDFEGLYRMMHAWIINKRFMFHEERYRDKIYTPAGNEVEIDWFGEKKVTEYVKEYIKVSFHLWDFSEVEIIKEGRKVKMTKSRMEIKIEPYLELDYTSKFSKGTNFEKMLGKFYQDKVIYWDWRIKYADSLTYQSYDLHTKVKKFLNLESDTNAY